jgi:two-component system sensor histidine kinase KdpD
MQAGAHDIRSPLTAVTGFVSTLAASWDRLEDERKRRIVAGMAMDGYRIGAQIRLLVDAVGLEAGTALGRAASREDVAEAARWIADLFRGGTELPDVRVEGSGEAAVERDRLRAVLLALCEGAAWWATEGPITVRVRPEDGGVQIDISRSGGGPTPEQAASILEAPESGGKVGLYAAGMIVGALGGSVTAEGGDGIRFRLRLP